MYHRSLRLLQREKDRANITEYLIDPNGWVERQECQSCCHETEGKREMMGKGAAEVSHRGWRSRSLTCYSTLCMIWCSTDSKEESLTVGTVRKALAVHCVGEKGSLELILSSCWSSLMDERILRSSQEAFIILFMLVQYTVNWNSIPPGLWCYMKRRRQHRQSTT